MSALKKITDGPENINVIQGNFAVGNHPETKITTILGSCIATCLFDVDTGVGGMNHFLLPGVNEGYTSTKSYGLNLMELLINNMIRIGARRNRIRAKIFGGACMHEGLTDVGAQNIEFARSFLEYEGIYCVGESVGGVLGRRIRFFPGSGKVQQQFLTQVQTSAVEEKRRKKPVAKTKSPEVVFF